MDIFLRILYWITKRDKCDYDKLIKYLNLIKQNVDIEA